MISIKNYINPCKDKIDRLFIKTNLCNILNEFDKKVTRFNILIVIHSIHVSYTDASLSLYK